MRPDKVKMVIMVRLLHTNVRRFKFTKILQNIT